MRKSRLFDWTAAGLFAAVAAISVVSLGGTARGGEKWLCPEEGDTLLRETGHGIDTTASRACTAARADANITCRVNSGSRDCCRFAKCNPDCFPFEMHGTCFASIDAWPMFQSIEIDGGDDGGEDGGEDGGGSGSGN